jgi:hypothetical protein
MSEGVLDGRAEQQLDDVLLARRALEVLEANWLGHGTRPSLLYPHQWSWDSACIAMGYARWNQPRAETELRSLFAGKWANGLLPHIVFAEGDGRYFPGPEFWQSERSPDSPSGVRTSGIVQPPLHATAALRVYRQSADRERATSFLRELAPKLRAWHEYLYRERTRGDDGLVEIWHPWESGMDNSPLWDEALARLDPAKAEIPDYQRVDVELADPSERPTDPEYDRYVYLVGLFRELDYGADRIHDATPFALQPVLFNSLLVQANLDLAEIAQVLGDDPEPFETWAGQTAVGIDKKLWNESEALYVDYDLRGGKHVEARSAAGLAPLYAGVPSAERAREMIRRLAASRVAIGSSGWAVASLSPDDPGFQPTRYWRGPVWPILNWVLQRGLDRYGLPLHAAQVRQGLIELSRGGFWEHYSPVTGAGHGGANFAWTAGLMLDILSTKTETKGARMEDTAIALSADGAEMSSHERRE